MEKFLKQYIHNQPLRMITYEDYMDLALYHPEFGYYSQPFDKIGARGDFYTSSNVGDAFGRALGKWFLFLFQQFDLPAHIVELGAGTGRLAHAILTYIKESDQELFSRLHYTVVEGSLYHIEKQRALLSQFDNVTYLDHVDCLTDIEGIIFSNELFDALPVHVIENREDTLYESMITYNQQLEEISVLLRNEAIKQHLNEYELTLLKQQRMEIPLKMISLYENIIHKLKKGIILTIDYGYTKQEWFEEVHLKGSLRGYSKHQMVENVLQKPGQQDLTTHIHWNSLRKTGEKNQLQTISFLSQAEFLLSCGILDQLQNTMTSDPFSIEHKRNRAIRTLIQDGQLSSHFQTLIQSKNLATDPLAYFV